MAPVLFAQEPQSPIVHTTDGPAQVFSETRVFINGKELSPEEVAEWKKAGGFRIRTHKATAAKPMPQPMVPVVQEGGRVFIHGHELPPEIAAHMIESGIVGELQAPVHKTQTIAPVERPEIETTCRFAPEAPVAEAPACKAPQVSMKVSINGQEINVPAHTRVHAVQGSHGVTVTMPEPPACDTPKPFCGQPCNCGPAPKPCTCTPDSKCGPTPKPCTCTPDNKCCPTNTPACDTKPAEPDTPVLPTPALPAAEEKPACPVQNAAAKVIINGKEVEIPAGKMMRITTDANGQPTIVPVD